MVIASELAKVQANLTAEQINKFSNFYWELPIKAMPAIINTYMPNAFEHMVNVLNYLLTNEQINAICQLYKVGYGVTELTAIEFITVQLFVITINEATNEPFNYYQTVFYITNSWQKLLKPKHLQLLLNLSHVEEL